MKVQDILKVKGNTLYTTSPNTALAEAVQTMAHFDIGSLVVIEYGEVVGILTFREILEFFAQQVCLPDVQVRSVMNDHPITCTPATDAKEVERIMLEKHARYIPVVDNKILMGVISFYDMSKAILENKHFENNLLKAYIRDWPQT